MSPIPAHHNAPPSRIEGGPLRLRHLLALLVVLAGGLFLQYGREIGSEFQRAQGSEDRRFTGWILEHDYRWMRGDPAHADLWSPPFFFPERNVGAYSEILVGLTPIYAVPRLAGLQPETAYAVFLLLLSALNFLAFFWLAFRLLDLGFGGATAGAYLFAFAALRSVQIGHMQLLAGFFLVGAAAAVVGLAKSANGSRRWIALFWGACVLQAYSGFYIAWFLAFFLALAVALTLTRREARARWLAILRRDRRAWAVGAILSAVACLPLAAHYLSAARRIGGRNWQEVVPLLPRPGSWFNLGPDSVLYGWLTEHLMGPRFPVEWEHRLGLGWITLGFVSIGIVLAWRKRVEPQRTLILLLAVAIVLVTRWYGDLALWRLVYESVPAASAVRATGRLAIVGLLPCALCVALAWQWLGRRKLGRLLLVPLAVAGVAEQMQKTYLFDVRAERNRSLALAGTVPRDCGSFFYSATDPGAQHYTVHLDAMRASLELDLPTLNGYSGNFPPEWPLNDAVERTPNHPPALLQGLRTWASSRRLEAPPCWIRWDGQAATATVERVTP